ncbi:MAG: aminoacyl-tRNA hydrolase, partial [Candidatus Nanopelagicales bacterium]
MADATWLVVGLGNIGEQYQKTRHNIGVLALEKL